MVRAHKTTRHARKLRVESLESRCNPVALGVDLALLSASLVPSGGPGPTVLFSYETDILSDTQQAMIQFFRTAIPSLDPNPIEPVPIDQTLVPASPTARTTQYTLAAPLSADPSRPYLLVSIGAAPPSGTLIDLDPTNNYKAISLTQPDLVPTTLVWDRTGSTPESPRLRVHFAYQVSNGPLTQPTGIALFWAKQSSDGTYVKLDADPASPGVNPLHRTTTDILAPGQLATFAFRGADAKLESIPSDATDLILEVDPENGIDEGPAGEANNDLPLAIPMAWLDRVDPQYRDAFQARVIEIADSLKTNPNYLMTVMAVETNGSFRPDFRDPNNGTVGLIGFTGVAAQDTLNALGHDRLIQLLSVTHNPDEIATLNIPDHFNDNDQALAKRIIRMIDVVSQLTLVEVYLNIHLSIPSVHARIVQARGNDGSPSNLGDLYGQIYTHNLISTNLSREIEYTEAYDLNHDGHLTVGETRRFLRRELIKGWAEFAGLP